MQINTHTHKHTSMQIHTYTYKSMQIHTHTHTPRIKNTQESPQMQGPKVKRGIYLAHGYISMMEKLRPCHWTLSTMRSKYWMGSDSRSSMSVSWVFFSKCGYSTFTVVVSCATNTIRYSPNWNWTNPHPSIIFFHCIIIVFIFFPSNYYSNNNSCFCIALTLRLILLSKPVYWLKDLFQHMCVVWHFVSSDASKRGCALITILGTQVCLQGSHQTQ